MLPQDFTDRMKDIMGAEYETFEASYEHTKYQALRINPLKTEKNDFKKFNRVNHYGRNYKSLIFFRQLFSLVSGSKQYC